MGFDIEIVVRLVWRGMHARNIPTKVSYPAGGVSHFRYGRDNIHIASLFTRLLIEGLVRGPYRILHSLAKHRPEHTQWHEVAERGSVGGLRLLVRVFQIAGRPALIATVVPVVLYMFIFGRVARRSAIEFQRRVVRISGGTPSSIRALWCAWRQFWQFGVAIIDKVTAWRTPLSLKRFVWHGRDEVKARLGLGQGLIMMSAHVGNLEVIRSLGENYKVMVHALMYSANSRHFRAILEEVNAHSFVRVHDLAVIDASLIFELQAALARGEIIALLSDRLPKYSMSRSITIPFLGSPAPFPEGPWVLAHLLEAPVYSVFCMREKKGLYCVEFKKLTERVTLPRAHRAEAIAEHVTRFANVLSDVALRYPTQWFNFYDFWQRGSHQFSQASPRARPRQRQDKIPHRENVHLA